jgi:hypothetical protein
VAPSAVACSSNSVANKSAVTGHGVNAGDQSRAVNQGTGIATAKAEPAQSSRDGIEHVCFEHHQASAVPESSASHSMHSPTGDSILSKLSRNTKRSGRGPALATDGNRQNICKSDSVRETTTAL